MECQQDSLLSRIETSTGSTYSPKIIDGQNRVNLRQITDSMRKTNFYLGYKPQAGST